MNEKIIKTVTEDQWGLRLDKALSLEPLVQSRSRAEHLIDRGLVFINSKIMKPSYLIKEGDQLEYSLPDKTNLDHLVASDLNIEIIYEDADLLVVNKPSGMVVHPAAGHFEDTLVNILITKVKNLSMGFGENRPGIVHRIDKETSGLLVVAKNDFSHESLSLQFKEKLIHRVYEAVVMGLLKNETGTLQSYLSRHPLHRKRFSSVLDSKKKIIRTFDDQEKTTVQIETHGIKGKWAVTHYKVLKQIEGLSLLEVRLETGRTHQIRVHLSELGFPIVGDVTYGATKKVKNLSNSLQKEIPKLDRFLLHAKELGFQHPRTGQNLYFKIPWPIEKIGKMSLK